MKNLNFARMIEILKNICMFGTIAVFSTALTYLVISILVWFLMVILLQPTTALLVIISGFLAVIGIARMIEIYNNK